MGICMPVTEKRNQSAELISCQLEVYFLVWALA